jgi:hypothetical protein
MPTHNADLPPFPWRSNEHSSGFIEILDANDRRIAVVWGELMQKNAVAEMILEKSREVSANRRLGGRGDGT